MRIGLFLPELGGNIEGAVQQVVDAERDGFDSTYFGQIFGADALTIIAIAGTRTSRIEMGTSVVPTYLRHPFAMAQQAMTVQAAAAGRFTLGIGLSHAPVVENMWGLSYEKPARHMREYLDVLLPLLREGKVAHRGEVFRVAANLQMSGVQPPSVMIAALAPAMLKLAGERTDGTITWMTGAPAIRNHIAPKLREAAAAAGRPAPRIVAGLPVCVTDDAAAARERAARAFVIYGQLPNYRRILDIGGVPGPADIALVGNEAEVERQVRDLAAAGATDLVGALFPVGDDAAASIARSRALLQSLIGKV
ncbi:MAG TPA: TIGR03564 family F420-dependent LLM class oxidoreductase [Dehalococcoidia bacterium]|nr:TIGR03564 family F420-dependent LLM class oxidoreductase [Dehalococcoidia bacterium]